MDLECQIRVESSQAAKLSEVTSAEINTTEVNCTEVSFIEVRVT
jgi:hypothetical protein